MGDDVLVEHVTWDHPDARVLRVEQQAELRDLYGDDDIGHAMTGEDILDMVVLRVDGAPAACGALRDASVDLGPGTGELKRMYVRRGLRGRGLSRRVLAEVEAAAAPAGLHRLVLETGVLQPEAIGLYLTSGYAPIDNFGEYVGALDSRCFAKDLTAPARPVVPARPAAQARPASPGDAVDGLEVERVPWAHPDAVALRRAMVDELAPLYPEHAQDAGDGFDRLDASHADTVVTTFLVRQGGVAVACVTHRHAPAWGEDTAELKRLYVAPAARGRGLARRLVGLVEDDARAHGARRVVLDTGIRQPEAIALYLSAGYRAVAPPAGSWDALPVSLWFAHAL